MEKAVIISLLAFVMAELDREIVAYKVATDVPPWITSVRHIVTNLIGMVQNEGDAESVKLSVESLNHFRAMESKESLIVIDLDSTTKQEAVAMIDEKV